MYNVHCRLITPEFLQLEDSQEAVVEQVCNKSPLLYENIIYCYFRLNSVVVECPLRIR